MKDFCTRARRSSPWAFIVGGVVMLVVERFRPAPVVFRRTGRRSAGRVAVGCCQALALMPGVSRSGATIVGGLLLRLDGRRPSSRFSWRCRRWRGGLRARSVGGSPRSDADRGAEIGVGFVLAFVAAPLVVRPFLKFVAGRDSRRLPGIASLRDRRSGGACRGLALGRRRRRSVCSGCGARFIAGFFVTVPLVVSVVAHRLGLPVCGPRHGRAWASGSSARRGPASGIVVTAAAILAIGALTTNVYRAAPAGSAANSCFCTCRCSARSTRRSSSCFGRFRRTTSLDSSGWCWSRTGSAARARVPDQGIHRRPRPRAGDAVGRVRADQSPLSGRHS